MPLLYCLRRGLGLKDEPGKRKSGHCHCLAEEGHPLAIGPDRPSRLGLVGEGRSDSRVLHLTHRAKPATQRVADGERMTLGKGGASAPMQKGDEDQGDKHLDPTVQPVRAAKSPDSGGQRQTVLHSTTSRLAGRPGRHRQLVNAWSAPGRNRSCRLKSRCLALERTRWMRRAGSDILGGASNANECARLGLSSGCRAACGSASGQRPRWPVRSPYGWIEPVEQVHDVALVELHHLDPAEPDRRNRITTADDPVPEAEPEPVLIPSPKELLSFIAGGEHVGRVVCARSLITMYREDRIDVSWRWPP